MYNSVSGRDWVVYECAVCIGATVYQTRTLLSSTSSVSVGSYVLARTQGIEMVALPRKKAEDIVMSETIQ